MEEIKMKDTRICDNCGAEHPISKMFEAEGDWLCEDCVDRLTVTCDRCGERIYQESGLYPEFCVNSALDVKQSKIFTRRHCNSRPPL